MQNKNKIIRCLISAAFLFSTGLVHAEDFFSQFIGQTIPTRLVAGDNATFKLSFKNSGDAAWEAGQGVNLMVKADGLNVWGIETIALPETVNPGGFAHFAFDVVAPEEPGNFSFSATLANGGSPFGESGETTIVRVEDATYQSQFISQLVPNTMETGKNYTITLQFKNSGRATWKPGTGFELKPMNPAIARTWKAKVEPLSSYIAPGDIASFSIAVSAPVKSGNYEFQWRINGIDGQPFGEASPRADIRVEPGMTGHQAEFVIQKVKRTMTAGKTYSVQVLMKNVGTVTWQSNNVSLASQSPANNLTWFINNVPMRKGEIVLPKDLKTFTFEVVAPQDPGVYDFQWQLYQDKSGFFGQATDRLKIRVLP